MASMVDQITVRAGTCPAVNFTHTGTSGDWQTFHVPFQLFMPNNAEGKIRIIVSASDQEINVSDHQAVPVAVVGEVSHMGFTAWVRNSDITPGQSGLNWVAIAEVPDTPVGGHAIAPPLFKTGSLQPQHFQFNGRRGDWYWRRWAVNYGTKIGFSNIPIAVVTPTNQNVRVHAASAIGVVSGSTLQGFNLAARNADISPGACNFSYLTVLPQAGQDAKLMVDTGQVPPVNFAATGAPGDWQVWVVNFAESFLMPPVVMVTADNGNGQIRSYARAAVGLVFDTTTHGFTLAARNSDIAAGPAGFSWFAVGYPG